MNKQELRSLIKEEIQKVINEAEDNGFTNYALALKLYSEKGSDPKYDKAFTNLFKGSKITSRFIVRSNSKPTESNYKKDIADFGKDKFDNLVSTVLDIIK